MRRFEVAIVGGGVAGLAAALRLAALAERDRARLRVALFERAVTPAFCAGASAAPLGLALAAAGGPLAPAFAENARLARVLAAEAGAGAALEELSAAQIRLGARPAAPALPALGVEPHLLLPALARRAAARGVAVVAGADVVRIETVADGAALATAGGERFHAARVLLAGGAWLAGGDEWLRSLALPARAEWCRSAPLPPLAERAAVLGDGLAALRQDSSGRVIAAELAEPANRGDPFDAAPRPEVQDRLERFLRSRLPQGASPRIEQRGAVPQLHTCDGVPLVGPHPGRSACVLATGFGGLDWSLGLAAGTAAADVLWDGAAALSATVPWSPRRML